VLFDERALITTSSQFPLRAGCEVGPRMGLAVRAPEARLRAWVAVDNTASKKPDAVGPSIEAHLDRYGSRVMGLGVSALHDPHQGCSVVEARGASSNAPLPLVVVVGCKWRKLFAKPRLRPDAPKRRREAMHGSVSEGVNQCARCLSEKSVAEVGETHLTRQKRLRWGDPHQTRKRASSRRPALALTSRATVFESKKGARRTGARD